MKYSFQDNKTQVFSKLIYYRKVYNIEMMRPNGQDCVLKNYFINELNQLENFYNKNIDFYKYYRSGSTHLDKYFFWEENKIFKWQWKHFILKETLIFLRFAILKLQK